MALPLHTRGTVAGHGVSALYKVLSLADALRQDFPLPRVIVDLRELEGVDLNALVAIGVGAILSKGDSLVPPLPTLHSLAMPTVVPSRRL
jgi:hypothetical protein